MASLVVLSVGYFFRKEIFLLFQRPRVTLQSTCIQGSGAEALVYDCNFQIQNETESMLSAYRIVIDSSKELSSEHFLNCTPNDTPDFNSSLVSSLVSETKGINETTCAYRIDLSSFGKMKFKLKISGDKNIPNPIVIQ